MGKRRLRIETYSRSYRFKLLKNDRENNSSSEESDQERERNYNLRRRINGVPNAERNVCDSAEVSSGETEVNTGSDGDVVNISSSEERNSCDDSFTSSDTESEPSGDGHRTPEEPDQQPPVSPASSDGDSMVADGNESSGLSSDNPPADVPDSPGNSFDGSPGGSSPSEDSSGSSHNSFSSEESGENSDEHEEADLLYPGASLYAAESMLSILSYSLTHNLSGSSLSDLLELISLHCPQPNPYQRSLYMFKKYFMDLSSPLQRHYFCLQCYNPLANPRDMCRTCNGRNGSRYYISISIISQLKALFKRPGFRAKLYHRYERRKQELGNIEDVYDGAVFKELCSEGQILSDRSSLALFWCTDGVPTSRSSKQSIWPFYLSILNLPYHERTKLDNIMLAGLWYGSDKPLPNLFLRPLQNEIESLNAGINFDTPEGAIFVRTAIIGGTADLPARALFLNMKQHNGTYGCQKCKIRSIPFEPGRGLKRVYPFLRNLTLRTDEETEQFATQAIALNTAVFGVKGHTILRTLVSKPVRSTSSDDMHPIYQGVVKSLMGLWFDRKHSNRAWSLFNVIRVVDGRLCSLTPPEFVQRLPRSIEDHLKYWKASELKLWLFYYSLPVLQGIMQPIYLNHWKLLVLGVYLLSKTSLSDQDIRLSTVLLTEFVSRFEDIYDRKFMTCNLHQLLHLPDVVKNLGPLWAHSCFPFENLNGKLLKLVTGTRFADLQICNAAALFLHLSTIKHEKLLPGTPAKAFCERLCNFKQKFKMTSVSERFCVVGKLVKVPVLPALVQNALLQSQIEGSNFHLFYRLFKRSDSMLFTCESYNRISKTKNFCVKYFEGNSFAFGTVLSYVRVSNCECGGICNECNAAFYAIVRRCNFENTFNALPRVPIPFIHKIFDLNEYKAVDINNLITVCFPVRVNDTYFVEPVNNVEVE